MVPPTEPLNLVAENVLDTSATLYWEAATDNVGVTGYEVYQDGLLIGSTPDLSYAVTGLSPTTSYSFYVVAKDASGNSSLNSNEVLVTTEVSGFIAGYYFESGLDGWIDGGLDCRRAFSETRSFEGSYSIQLRDNSDSSNVESPGLDLLGNNSVSIEFHAYLTAYEPGETFSIEFYDGVSYQEIGVYEQGVDFDKWEFFTDTIILDGSNYTFTSSNTIRFVSHADDRSDQVYIDQVIISGDFNTTNSLRSPILGSNSELVDFDFTIYPNPASEVLFVTLKQSSDNSFYTIVNMLGQTVSRGVIENEMIPLESIQSGIYILNIQVGDQYHSKRFVKE